MSWQRRIAWPLVSFVAITLGCVAIFGMMKISWEGWRPATCMPEHCFCEYVRFGSVVRQPANTWSNLGFVWVGLLILGMWLDDRRGVEGLRNRMTHTAAYPVLYGVVVIFIGLTSLFFHASLSFLGQWFDVMSMYLLALFMVLYNFARFVKMGSSAFVGAYLAANAVCGYAQYAWPEVRRYLFAGLLLLALLSEIYVRLRLDLRIERRYLWYALGSMASAFTIWTLDLKKIVCWPTSLLQGHAIWHLLCAVAAGCIYMYYRSERMDQALPEQ